MKTHRFFMLHLILCLVYGTAVSLSAQSHIGDLDSVELLMDRNYKPVVLGISEKGTYVTVQKRYGRSSDTVAVYNTADYKRNSGYGNGNKAVVNSHKAVSTSNKSVADIVDYRAAQVFLGDDVLVSTSPNKAEYRNLKTGRRLTYDNIKRTLILPGALMYCILDRENRLSVYDRSGKRIYSLDKVTVNPVSDDKRNAFVTVKNGEKYVLYQVSGIKPVQLLESETAFDQVMLSNGKNFLVAVNAGNDHAGKKAESEKIIGTGTVAVMDDRTGKMTEFRIPDVQKNEPPGFLEFGNGRYLLMATTLTVPRNRAMEIWYGNDGDLMRNEQGTDIVNRYRVLDLKLGTVREIPKGGYTDLVPSGNGRHLLAFRSGALQNYITMWQNADMKVYDLETGRFTPLDVVKTMDLYLSSQGNIVMYRNTEDQWVLADLVSGRKEIVKSKDDHFRNPVFAENDQTVYFESNTGLYSYSTEKNGLQLIPETRGRKVRITNRKKELFPAADGSFQRLSIKDKEPLIVEMTDADHNLTSFAELRNGKYKVLLPETANRITTPYFTENVNIMICVEENYSLPPKVMIRDLRRKKSQVVFDSADINRSNPENRKQEIIRYTDAEGHALKGVLYYPAGFDPLKKYPMVVRIYQIQSKNASEYPVLGYTNPPTFDLKRLVENGYFVYLPDIVFGRKGTGLSALDCVHKALDAVADRVYIDRKKIGLTGHSHGGYETNFIATHSNRFAAYLSGAGNSDLVRSYYSYNYNFHSPFYWQYENGQYEMPASFVADKELYIRNSPVYHAEKVNAPILLWAGKKDKNIAWDQVMEFYIALKRNEKDVIALFYPDQGHAPAPASAEGKDLYRKTQEWWDYFLKDQRNIPWIDRQMTE